MSADRELLETAAEAAGLSIRLVLVDGSLDVGAHMPPWNPLANDGDALRLAVNQLLQVTVATDGVHVEGLTTNGVLPYAFEPHGADPYAATRRAIVRAAAALKGKT